MLVFIPLLVAYTTLWSSVLIFRVPIPTPSPVLLDSVASPASLLSLVSAVEEINTAIGSLPAVSDIVYSATKNMGSTWYLDASPISPIPHPLNLPTCTPSDWPTLSDFSYLGTRICDRVSRTDLVIWDGPLELLNLASSSTPMANEYSSEDIRYFVTLVASGVGFWLVCRLIAAVILKSAPAEVCGYRCRFPSCGAECYHF